MKAEENIRQVINKILHSHIDVNKHEDYTNYKKLITDIENLILQQRKEAERELIKFCLPNWVDSDRETIYNEFQDYKSKQR